MKTTRWFPRTVKPVRIGVYEVESDSDFNPHRKRAFAYWNGRGWGMRKWGLDSIDDPIRLASRDRVTFWPELRWRGLAKQP